MKEQIKIPVIGLGWKELHYPWFRDGKYFIALQLKPYLMYTIITEKYKPDIPNVALAAALLSFPSSIQLGTGACNLIEFDKGTNKVCDKIKAKVLRELEEADIEKIIAI